MTSSKSIIKLAAWAGLIGSFLFVAVFTIEGFLRPGYSPLAEYVSALSLGPRGWIQVTNFLVFGATLFIFSRGIAVEFKEGKASRWGIILLMIISACYFFSGPFVMDPAGTPVDQSTIHGLVHGILGAIVFLLMPTTMFVFYRRFREDPKWRSLQGWTLFLGVLSAVGLILLTATSKFPDLAATFAPWFGIIQRLEIVPFMVWVFIFALTMLRKDSGK